MLASRLWKAYYEDDAAAFNALLEASAATATRGGAGGSGSSNAAIGVGMGIGSSPHGASPSVSVGKGKRGGGGGLTRADVNSRDGVGQTLLHHAVSSTAAGALDFVAALVEHPLVDLYAQDWESGWTALHRAFYFGNVTAARLVLERDARDVLGRAVGQTAGLVKVKDKEGLGPLDLYAATIRDRGLRVDGAGDEEVEDGDGEVAVGDDGDGEGEGAGRVSGLKLECDQLFNFGSNKNVSLGFGDEDDRAFPERINLRRPEHLLRQFYAQHLDEQDRKWAQHDPDWRPSRVKVADLLWAEDIPFQPKSRPLLIQDVQMAKLSSAILSSDPEANLYMCGHGQGGRLGVGDEQTRFHFVCVEGGALPGKRVVTVALGLNHTLALAEEGEIFSWGNNGYGQLGYNVSKAASDDDPISTTPRQIFGPLKRETVAGVAASRIHSVAHTGGSLFTFGKNEGQLGIVDSDARSLETQVTPRKVAPSLFASPIAAVAAMDKATVCLLASHEVWVFANYGYAKVQFPLDSFSNYFLQQSFLATSYDKAPNRIVKLTCGGDTLCALSSRGEIHTLTINTTRQDSTASASTTNPAKIRSAISQPQRVWSPKKSNMAARDVGVDADGSIILSTEEGSVWKRTKRAKIKDATAAGSAEYKPKDYKFSRVPGLTRVLAVRASAHGAYAAVRRDCDVTKTQIVVEDPTLWKDLAPMLSLHAAFARDVAMQLGDEERHRFWQASRRPDDVAVMRAAVVHSEDVEADLEGLAERSFADASAKYDAVVRTTSSDVEIPVHRFVLTGRSRTLRRALRDVREGSPVTLPELATCESDTEGRAVLTFQGLDILTIIDLVIYLYSDGFIEFWQLARGAGKMAHRYRQVRTELMKVATRLELGKLEPAARQMVQPRACLDLDFEVAFRDPAFFDDGDVVVQLEDGSQRVHSALVCARCPFFEGLFMGRAGGRWLAGRETEEAVKVDLKHISSKTFALVLRHIYADSGAELFDGIVSVSVDDFLDAVTDVLSAANELMLDRLSQFCQQVLGRFVNVRNVCSLLNAVAPCSVPEFKHAALDYLCLSLEAMLQGHHLNELDPDLLDELDAQTRENQLACLPFAKSGYAEARLLERNPELAELLERNRQARIDAVALRAKFQDIDAFAPGSFGDEGAASPVLQKARRRSSNTPKAEAARRPSLRAKASTKDMFTMDEELEDEALSIAQSPSLRPVPAMRPLTDAASSSLDNKAAPSPHLSAQAHTPAAATPITPKSPVTTGRTPSSSAQPWGTAAPLPGARTDMKDIMAQAATSRTSSLSAGLASTTAPPTSPDPIPHVALPAPKLSQKDRKRLQQSAASSPPARPGPALLAEKPPSPAWQPVTKEKPASLTDVLNPPKARAPAAPSNPSVSASASSSQPGSRSASTPHLTMRQTVANPKPTPPAQNGKPGSHEVKQQQQHPASPPPAPPTHSKPVPRSIRHQPPPEQILGLSMEEILAAQQLEKDVVRDAVAKRDLGDIQAEQEFQEWWDKESARVQEAEAGPSASASTTGPAKGKRARGRGGGGGRGGAAGMGGKADRGRGGKGKAGERVKEKGTEKGTGVQGGGGS